MSDDRTSQPIDMRIVPREPSYRDLLLQIGAEIGALKSSVDHGHQDRRILADKLDILADKVDDLHGTVQASIGDGRIQDRELAELKDIVLGSAERRIPGLSQRVDSLEIRQEKAKNLGIGIGIGSAIGGTGFGAALATVGKKLGLWTVALIILTMPAFAAPPDGADPSSPVATWYRSLEQPVTGIGCCSISDCRPLPDSDWRQTLNGYEVRWKAEWLLVKQDRILMNKDNPTGMPVACVFGFPAEVQCFVIPPEA